MIAVVGGTGTLGSVVVESLLERGREVRILSRNPPDQVEPGCEHMALDLSAADGGHRGGFGSAIEGARAVIDLANNSIRPGPVMLEGSSRLIEACGRAEVEHFIGVSIIGCEKVPLAYYRAKAHQEKLVRESPVGWSLLRATQFHELIDRFLAASARFRALPGGPAPLQPVAADAVAARLAEIAVGEPLNDTSQLAGPERRSLGELSRAWLKSTGRQGLVLKVPLIGRAGRAIGDGAFTDPSAAIPGAGFEAWLRDRYGSSGE